LIAPGRTRTCGPLLSFQHQAFPDRPSMTGLLAGLYLGHHSPDPYSLWGTHPSVLPDPNGRFPADYPILRIVTHTAIEYL